MTQEPPLPFDFYDEAWAYFEKHPRKQATLRVSADVHEALLAEMGQHTTTELASIDKIMYRWGKVHIVVDDHLPPGSYHFE